MGATGGSMMLGPPRVAGMARSYNHPFDREWV